MSWLVYQDLFYYAGELEYSGKGNGERRLTVGNEMVRVDGYHEESCDVLEFLGCVIHGCDKCYEDDGFISLRKGKTMKLLRLETQNRLSKICHAGYNIISIWECEWKRMSNNDDEIKEHLEILAPYIKFSKPPKDPREALFGGRTEACCLLKEYDLEIECVKGVDFTSC